MTPQQSKSRAQNRGTRRRPKGSGRVRQLPSGRWQARFTGPDGRSRPAPQTFDTKLDASAWLAIQHEDVEADRWQPPAVDGGRRETLATYAKVWMRDRPIGPRTRSDYQRYLDDSILPTFGDVPLDRITPDSVRNWFAVVAEGRPTTRARVYGLLRAIMATAYAEDRIEANPCRIRGGGSAKTKAPRRPATLAELQALTEAMPQRYQLMVALASWCALRFGELTELRRADIDLTAEVIKIRRAVTKVDGEFIIGPPKTEAGIRDVAIPSALMPSVVAHLDTFVDDDATALVFPARHGGHMAPSALYKVFYPARTKAGRTDLRWHDLRHTGAVLAATQGATLADLMSRLGHSSAQAAMIYQHQAEDRDRVIADALSDLMSSGTTGPIPAKPKAKR